MRIKITNSKNSIHYSIIQDIVKNGKFNSVFGMNKTRLNKKLNSYKDNDVIYPLIEDYIVK